MIELAYSRIPAQYSLFRFCLLTYIIVVQFAAHCAVAQSVTFDGLLQDIVNRDLIAIHPSSGTGFKQLQTSTSDSRLSTLGRPSTFTNRDFIFNDDGSLSDYPLYGSGASNTERVVMDADGPGVLSRLWLTGGGANQVTYRFYVDGESTPVFTGNGEQVGNSPDTFGDQFSFERGDEFFDGTNVRNGGMNLYAPITYNNNLTVTIDTGSLGTSVPGTFHWFSANHRQYTSGTQVQTFSPQLLANSTQLTSTNQALANRTGSIGQVNTTYTDSQRLATGNALSYDLEGEGAIRNLEVKIEVEPGGDLGKALRQTYVELTFDSQLTTRVPVGHFFGNGYSGGSLNDDPSRNINAFDDWWRSVKPDGTMSARWPMPFEKSSQVRIVNASNQPVSVDLQVESGEWSWGENSMHFHANFREENDITTRGRDPATRLSGDTDATADWRYVSVRGKGVYVGDNLSIRNPQLYSPIGDGRDSIWWGEGDEKVYIDYLDANGDGSTAAPNHIGTGTEDYYGYAWAARGEFDAPFISQPLADGNSNYSGQTVNGRVRILDTIPFEESLKFDMEIWHGSDSPVNSMDYAASTYWYGRPGAVALIPVADLATDFRAAQNDEAAIGIDDSTGEGSWSYFASDNADPSATGADLQALTWGNVGNAGNQGFGGDENGSNNLAAISDKFLFADGVVNIGILGSPGYHELALHPGGSNFGGSGNTLDADREYVVAQWTAGESVEGLINIGGSIRNLISTDDSIDFYIYVNGSLEFAVDANGTTLDETTFDFDSIIAPGQTVEFVLGNGGAGNLYGDESLLRAIISAEYSAPLSILGDLDNDGTVGVIDWHILRDNFGTPTGDLNNDGINNVADYLIFRDVYINNFGVQAFEVIATVPEPSAWLLSVILIRIVLAPKMFRSATEHKTAVTTANST